MKYYKEINNEIIFFKGNVLYTEDSTIVNPTEEDMLAAGWQVYVEPEPTADELLTRAKSDKIAQIENYDASPNVEQFTINDIPMWLGHEVRQQIRTSADAYAAMGRTEMTKIFNGQEFTFEIEQWYGMLNLLEIYAAEALNTTERHKAAVNQLATVEAVTNYDYTTDYPTKLEF